MPDRLTRVHQQVFIQELALKFTMPGMLADVVSPRVPVKKQSDLYRIWGKDRFVNRGANATRWAPGTTPNEITMKWSQDSYFAELYKLRTKVLDSERRNSDSDLDLDGNATEYVTTGLVVGREARVATLFTTAANFSSSHKITKSGGSEYDQSAVISTGQILTDIDSLVSQIKLDALCTSRELTAIIPDPVFDKAVKRNASILDKIKFTQKGIVTPDLVAELLDIKQVLIGQGISATPAIESEGSDVLSGYTTANLWGDNIWIGLIPTDAKNAMQPAFSRTFGWNDETGGQDRQVRPYRDPDEGHEADWIEVKEASGEKIQFKDAGALIINCLQ